jgi:hypothetical protein
MQKCPYTSSHIYYSELDRAWNQQNEQRLNEEEARNKLKQEVLYVRSTQVQTKGMKCCHGTDQIVLEILLPFCS